MRVTVPRMMRSKVGIVGSGAVGTYFGVRLAEAGHDVRFLISPRHEVPSTFKISSWQGAYELEAPVVKRTPEELGTDLDWVLVCLKGSALEENEGQVLDRLVKPCLNDETRIQLLMNGLGAEEMAASRFGAHRVHGGLVYGGLTRPSIGVATHQGVPAEIRGGSFTDSPKETELAGQLWAPTKIAYTPQPCLLKAQWAKLAWNIPFNGLTVAAGGVDVSEIWLCEHSRAAAVGLIREVADAANADLRSKSKDTLDPDALVDQLSSITDKMAATKYLPSTTVDFRDGKPMEIGAIFAEPLRRANRFNVPVPRLQMLLGLLQTLNKSSSSIPSS